MRGLYALTPEIPGTAALCERVRQALEGGARWVQYRAKLVDAATRADQAAALVALCASFGARLIVNDDADLAAAAGAAGVHLGRDDGPVAAARARLGSTAIVGVSCYDDLDRARHAQAQGADYVAFGSFFASRVKPGAVRPSLDLLFAARRALQVPIVAIGGITLDNAASVIAAGADAVAVITDLFTDADPAARARAYGRLFAADPVASC